MKNLILISMFVLSLVACSSKKEDDPQPAMIQSLREEPVVVKPSLCHGKDSSYTLSTSTTSFSINENCSRVIIKFNSINIADTVKLPAYDHTNGQEVRKYNSEEEQREFYNSKHAHRRTWRVVLNASGIVSITAADASGSISYNSRLGYNPNYNK